MSPAMESYMPRIREINADISKKALAGYRANHQLVFS